MSLLFCDSFSHYAFADMEKKYNAVSPAQLTIHATAGRRGGPCLRAANSSYFVRQGFPNTDVVFIGFAVKPSAAGNNTDFMYFFGDGSNHITVKYNSANGIRFENSGTLSEYGTTAAGVISTGVWNYVEIKVKIADGTDGLIECRVNGLTVLNLTGIDTRYWTYPLYVNAISLGGFVAANTDICDLYICDDNGSTNNDFLGDVRVDAYLPAGNGNSSGFVGSDADSTDNYLLVDESSPDGDTTYVESSTPSAKDLYAFAEVSHTPLSIIGTQLCALARKSDVGARTVHLVTRSDGVDYDTATAQGLSTDYTYKLKVDDVDPDTSAAWTKTNLNNAEFGIKVAS